MASRLLSLAALLAASVQLVAAGDDKWLSPVYTQIYQNPLPFPPVKQKLTFASQQAFPLTCLLTPISTYTNATTGIPIDYYEITISEFDQQVYPGKKPARLLGYDGISPGPTFMMEKGRESVVRFINKGIRESAIHLHGSYSVYSHILYSRVSLTVLRQSTVRWLGRRHDRSQ